MASSSTALLFDKPGEIKPYVYQVTDEDRADFYRCIWREGAPQKAVGWTLLQRFAFLTPKPYKTLSAFLRAYCQPINPRWFTDGSLHLSYHARLLNAGKHRKARDEKRRAENRERYAQTPVEEIPAKYRVIADRILSGREVSPVPEAMHFSVSRARAGTPESVAAEEARQYAKRRGFGPPIRVQGGWSGKVNWFFKARGAPPPRVAVRTRKATRPPPGPAEPPGAPPGPAESPGRPGPALQADASGAAAAALAVALLAMFRKRR